MSESLKKSLDKSKRRFVAADKALNAANEKLESAQKEVIETQREYTMAKNEFEGLMYSWAREE